MGDAFFLLCLVKKLHLFAKSLFSYTIIKIGVAATMFSCYTAHVKTATFPRHEREREKVTVCVCVFVYVWVYGSMPLCALLLSQCIAAAPGLARGIIRMALTFKVCLAWMQVCTSSLCQLFPPPLPLPWPDGSPGQSIRMNMYQADSRGARAEQKQLQVYNSGSEPVIHS